MENLKKLMVRFLGYLRCSKSAHLSSPTSFSQAVELPEVGIVGTSLTGTELLENVIDYPYSQVAYEILYRGYFFV